MLCAGLDAAGLENYRIGLGDASLYRRLLDRLAVPEGARPQILHELVTRDFVGLAREVEAHGHDELLRVPQLRGGIEVLEGIPEAGELRAVHDLLAPEIAARVIFDLGLIRDLDYYTGAVFEVYDAALGAPLGGGGPLRRPARALRPRPAGLRLGLNVERLHLARVGEGR